MSLWSIKKLGRLLFGKEKPRKVSERYMKSEDRITNDKPLVCDFKIRKETPAKSMYPAKNEKQLQTVHY